MKVVYTMEQMQELSRCLNELTVKGLDNCKLIALCTQIIDNPTEIEKGDTDDDNKEDNPKHKQRQTK